MATRNLILVDPPHRDSLKPLSWARPVSSIRIGILTIADKWERALDAAVSWSVPDYLQVKFPARVENENFLVQGHLLPGQDLRYIITKLGLGEVLVCREQWVAARLSESQAKEFLQGGDWKQFRQQEVESRWIRGIRNLWEIFQWNDLELRSDFEILTGGRQSAPADPSNRIMGDQFFMEEGAKVMASTINTHSGPVYLGFQSEIMEGCMIRGALALCERAQLKMGAKIYGATTIGPESRIGGEVNNAVIQGYSNKAHDGFLGNALLGEWCNIGADSNNSNLKNNYEPVKLWDYASGRFIPTGSLFCGLVMGDHAKCGINTMFNTGTVVGYGANVFGDGFPRQFIPDFAWGGAAGFSTFQLQKFYHTAAEVVKRRDLQFDPVDQAIAASIFEQSRESRIWERS